jgi:hypothetical protein
MTNHSSECELQPHGDEHPCGKPSEAPGTPCRFCGAPVPLDGSPCPACWSPITNADFRAICAEANTDTVQTGDGWRTA